MKNEQEAPASIFSVSACFVGFLLTDNMTANEQNALGNWLMLVSQYLCTNASYLQYIGSKRINNQAITTEETVAMLEKMIESLSVEVNSLKKL